MRAMGRAISHVPTMQLPVTASMTDAFDRFHRRNHAGNTAADAVKERLREHLQEPGWLDEHLLCDLRALARDKNYSKRSVAA